MSKNAFKLKNNVQTALLNNTLTSETKPSRQIIGFNRGKEIEKVLLAEGEAKDQEEEEEEEDNDGNNKLSTVKRYQSMEMICAASEARFKRNSFLFNLNRLHL